MSRDGMRIRYCHEKIAQAVRRTMLHDDLETLADAFGSVELSTKNSAPLTGQALAWQDELLAMIKPSSDDFAAAKKNGTGGYYERARRFTVDNKINFARTLWELHGALTSIWHGAAPLNEED